MKKWVWLTVSWFGVSGLFSRARGTWGTLAALPFAYLVQVMFGNVALAAAACALFVLGIIASQKYMDATGKDDPNEVVIDEVVGVCILLSFMVPNWQCYLAAFILFRIFDVIKPWPVLLADQKIKGGLGVMVDDVLAALYPIALMAAVTYVKPEWAERIMSWLQLQ